jgi:hypothetical protein
MELLSVARLASHHDTDVSGALCACARRSGGNNIARRRAVNFHRWLRAPYEHPKLTAIAVGRLTGEDFATRLDLAIERSNRAKLIEGRVVERDD